MDNQINIDNEKYKSKLKRREFLDETRIKTSNTLDKYLLSFSTASIYLSLYFRDQLLDVLVHRWLLIVSWSMLLFCILIVLISFKISEKAHEKQIRIIDASINDKNASNENCWTVLLGWVNFLSMSAFISGIIFLVIFFIFNIR